MNCEQFGLHEGLRWSCWYAHGETDARELVHT